MYLWGARWSPRLTLPQSWSSLEDFLNAVSLAVFGYCLYHSAYISQRSLSYELPNIVRSLVISLLFRILGERVHLPIVGRRMSSGRVWVVRCSRAWVQEKWEFLEVDFDLLGDLPPVQVVRSVTSWHGGGGGSPGFMEVAWGTAVLLCPSHSSQTPSHCPLNVSLIAPSASGKPEVKPFPAVLCPCSICLHPLSLWFSDSICWHHSCFP